MQESIRFASSGDDIKIWDSSSITVVEQFNPHTSHSVNSLCWGNNNNFLVTASTIGDKIVVSSCKGKLVPLFELAEGAKQTCVSLNSSSVHIVSGGLDNTVKIWDLKSRRLHRCLKDHKDEVTCVTFNWNDCYIASGSMSGEIILHNVTTNLSSTPFGHGSSQVGLDTHGVKFIPVRRSSAKPMHHLKDPAVDSPFCRLTEIGKTGRFPWGNSPLMAHLKNYLWRLLMDCVVIKTITVKTTGNLDLRTSDKELENFRLGYTVQVLFSIGAKLINLYCSCYLFRESWTTALQTVQYLKDFSCNKAIMACQNLKVILETHYISLALSHSKPIRHLKYSSFKKSLLGSVSDSGTVTLWDVNSQNPYHNFENAHKAPASEICFSPVNELLLVTIGLDKRIILYDTSSKKLLRTLVAESPLTAVDFMPDGTTLAIGSSRGKIYHYDLRKLTSPVKTVSAHKTSVKCIRLQYSSTCSKSSFNKCSSNKPASKRTDVKASSNVGGIQNTGIIKNLTSNTPITVSPQPMSTIESKGADVVQDKTGFPRCGSMNVILSKETDHGKSANMTNFDDLGRDSLGDMFSPVRDDVAVYKTNEDLPGKGDGLDFQPYFPGLDFLPQFNTVFPIKRNTVGACMQGTHSSPLHAFVSSPIKEEDEHPNQDAEATKINIGKQESRESVKQLSKLSSSNAESGNSNTPPLPTVIKTPEANERLGKNIQALLMSDSPVNGTTSATPKITSSVTAGVASSLSEKIVDTIGSNRPNAPLTSVQIHFIQNMIQETLDDFREACHRDIVNLQVEMIKQFHMQLNEMHALLGRYSVNESLVAEIERLREENKRLRTHF